MIRLIQCPPLQLLPLFFLIIATSCQPIPQEETTEKPKPKVRDHLVGIITSVNDDYVLIQKYGEWLVPEDDIVFSKGADGQTANLKFSGEQLGQFIAADIRSGSVSLKDGVYWRQILKHTKDGEPSVPSVPSPSSTPPSTPPSNPIPQPTPIENSVSNVIPAPTPQTAQTKTPSFPEPQIKLPTTPPSPQIPATGNTQWEEVPLR